MANGSRASLVGRATAFATSYATGAAAALYLLTLGVARPRHRALLRHLAEEVGTRRPPPLALPTLDPDRLGADAEPIALLEPVAVDGTVSLLELLCLARLVRAARPRTILEIGTFDGRTTLNLAANAPDATVHTLDLPAAAPTALAVEPSERTFIEKPASGARFVGRPEAARIVQHFGDSATFEFAPLAESVDLAFVDGSHAYDYVVSDSRRVRALLPARGGVIVWHDYGIWPGVTRALEELAHEPSFAGLRHIAGTSLVVLETRA
jgi:hypothetical protein